MSAGPTLGRRRCRRRYIRTVVVVSLAVGDECRRCRVPGLPRPVVSVSPAAGDKPQPYIRSAALPPAGWGLAPAVQGSGPPLPVVGVPLAAGDKPQPYIRSAALPPALQGAALPPAVHLLGGYCMEGR